MTSRSLTLVLPAYNEAGRIEPALDELFGYLHRRGAALAFALTVTPATGIVVFVVIAGHEGSLGYV